MTTLDRASAQARISRPAALTAPNAPQLAASLLRARAALHAAVTDYLAIPDAALLTVWLFRGIDTEDGVRYGIYRGAETIEAAHAELEAALAGAPARAPGAIRVAPATVARWALQGRLAGLDDSILDRVPRQGEWTIRRTLDHIIDGQRSYGWFTRWWLSQPLGADRPAKVTDDAEEQSRRELPKDGAAGEGSLAEIRARLDDAVDEWSIRDADLDAEALRASGTWAGVTVDIDFRLGRWASHIREHTVQIDKTLQRLGHEPSEPARIVRDLYATWGRLESLVFPVAPAGTESAVDEILNRSATSLVSEAASVRAAAEV